VLRDRYHCSYSLSLARSIDSARARADASLLLLFFCCLAAPSLLLTALTLMESWGEYLAEHGYLPDWLLRRAIRQQLAARLQEQELLGAWQSLDGFVRELRASPIAIETSAANRQHYEVPTEFYRLVLGPRLKYSCTYWPDGVRDLGASEIASLELVAERARLCDGLDVLELGCGWGSFTLWAAERYRGSRFVAVSNSSSQRAFIEQQARERQLSNVRVVTADMNDFAPDSQQRFDRIVSIEMFEHMRNYAALLERVASWLKRPDDPDESQRPMHDVFLFVHIFTHACFAYPYRDDGGWMARTFFTGGIMPSTDLLLHFCDHLKIVNRWRLDGTHYSRTLEAWLQRQDLPELRQPILDLFAATYGSIDEARLWFQRWRMFWIACSELFNYRQGREWFVTHYLFQPHGQHAQ